METHRHPLYKVRYRHLGWTKDSDNIKHNGIITVSAEIRLDEMVVGFSFCAPGDCFSRKFGCREADKHRRHSPLVLKGTDPKAIIELLIKIERAAGFVYDYEPHFIHGRPLTWLAQWLLYHFPMTVQGFMERNACRV